MRGPTPGVRHCRALLAVALAFALAATACGGDEAPAPGGDAVSAAGDDEGSAAGDGEAASAPSSDEGDTDVDGEGGLKIDSDDGQFQVGLDDRPDWLPSWVLLPEELEITFAVNDLTLGESAVTGTLAGADIDELYVEAVAMVESGGYVIGEESQTVVYSFDADHTSDGSVVRFSMIEFGPELAQWALEFSTPVVDESTDTVVESEPAPAGSAILTISIAGQSWTTTGRCNGSQFDFEADNARSSLSIISDPGGYGDFAVGTVSRMDDGEVAEAWYVGNSMDVVSVEKSSDRLFFEGDMRLGERTEVAVVEVDCG